MSKVMSRMAGQFDTEQLMRVMTSMTQSLEVDAGYGGEGHAHWKSLTLYSKVHGVSDGVERLPVIDDLLARSGLAFRLVRFMKLAPGGHIRRHTDSFLSGNTVRVHIPIRTNPDARLHIDGERCDWEQGELWFGDFSKPHWGSNESQLDRIHLVMDVELNAGLLDLLEDAEARRVLATRLSERGNSDADRETLKRFKVAVRVPGGFSLPGVPMEPLPTDAVAEVIEAGNELLVMLNNQPMLKAIPVSEEMLDLVGLPSSARLHYRFERDVPTRVSMILGMQTLELEVVTRQ